MGDRGTGRIVADVGGTTARFARIDAKGRLAHLVRYPVAGIDSFEVLVARFVESQAHPLPPDEILIAAAGPVVAGTITMTNAPWTLSETGLAAAFPGTRVALFNDLEAVALALPTLPGDAFAPVVGDLAAPASAEPDARHTHPRLVVNVGTGFGAALAVPHAGAWVAIATEAGHVTLPATGPDDAAVIGDARTVEDLISGPGLTAARDRCAGTEADARLTETFSRLFGASVRDLVLATGAWSGVCLCGGVVDAWDTCIDRRAFVDALAGAGPMRSLTAAVPVHRIVHPAPALHGLAQHGPLR